MHRPRKILVLVTILAAWVIWTSPSAGADPAWEYKVVPSVLQHDPAEARDFFISWPADPTWPWSTATPGGRRTRRRKRRSRPPPRPWCRS